MIDAACVKPAQFLSSLFIEDKELMTDSDKCCLYNVCRNVCFGDKALKFSSYNAQYSQNNTVSSKSSLDKTMNRCYTDYEKCCIYNVCRSEIWTSKGTDI